MVPREDLPAWAELMAALGYVGLSGWHKFHSQRFEHHLPYRRPIGDRELLCELHTCMFVERRARRLDYSALIETTEPSTFPRFMELQPGSQLVVLALHLFHHRHGERRLIWFRDFLELANSEAVLQARRLAGEHGVGWALEWALHEVEKLVGVALWQSKPQEDAFGLAQVLRLDSPGSLYHLALVRELGLFRGMQYVASRFDPRRLWNSPEGSAPAALRAAASRNLKAVASTPWVKALWRR